MKFKTTPFKHQLKAFNKSKRSAVFALLMEQGTGKSKVFIDTCAYLWEAGLIDFVLIIAPKGVAPGWLRQEFPAHCSVPYKAALWRTASNITKAQQRQLAEVRRATGVLKVIIMNTEAFGATDEAIDFAIEILDESQSAMVGVDESQRIKNPQAHTTKRIINLRIRSAFRRILSGTPITQGPFDAYTQFGFLDPAILQTESFVAFKQEYAVLLKDTSGLMRHIARRVPKKWAGDYLDDITGAVVPGKYNEDGSARKQHMVPIYMPSIVAKNADGTPMYRNLDKLHDLIAPHSFRVLKRDCLDLPEKLYNRYYTEMSPRQAAIYAQVRDELRIQWEDDRVTTMNRLTMLLRLQQIVCGYISEGELIHNLFPTWEANPRIVSMIALLEDRPEKERGIIWCRFVEDIKQVSAALESTFGEGSVVQFYGAIHQSQRIENVERFQGERHILNRQGARIRVDVVPEEERPRYMVSQQRAGGIGQTWTAANLSLYYSNSFSLEDRLQSEDRPHRIGQRNPVQYIDMECEDTVDSNIITSLIAKKDVADTVTGDKAHDWLRADR